MERNCSQGFSLVVAPDSVETSLGASDPKESSLWVPDPKEPDLGAPNTKKPALRTNPIHFVPSKP